MDSIEIKRGNTVLLTVPVDDTFTYAHTLMGEQSVTCTLRAVDAVKLQAGDHIEYGEMTYTLYDEPEFSRAEGAYAYTIAFYAPYYRLFHVLMKDEGAVSFPYFGGVSDHLNLLLTNIQAIDPEFTLGTVEENGSKDIEYEQNHCYDALVKIAETFDLEWEVKGKTISVRKRVGQDTAHIFEYGQGKGLYSLQRQMLGDTAVVTRLYGLGGSQNIPASFIQDTGYDRLVFTGRYLEKNTAAFGIREGVAEFEDIYPRLKDKKVLAVTVPDDIPNAKTWTLRLDIPFDLAGEIIKDREPVVNFLSGELTGESFKIAEGSWKNDTKELKIIVTDDNGYYLPRETRQPKVGDLFNLTEINMPEAYITEAQEELQQTTADKLNQLCEPQYSHTLEIDPAYAKKKGISVDAGDKVTVREMGHDALIRVQQVSYPIARPNRLSLTLSDERLYTYEQKIEGEIVEVTDKANQNAAQQAQKYSSRTYRDVMEAVDLLGDEVSLIGNPDAIFVISGVFYEVNKNNDPNSFYATKGQLQHDRYKDNAWNGRWIFANDFTATLSESGEPYYLYARCSKTENQAMFVVSLTAIGTEEVDGYYHFHVGIISSEYNDARVLLQTYGFTFTAGGSIKTGTILSVNGDTYFNLDAGEIGGKIVFSDRSTTENGTTLISGGKINTNLIDADMVVARAASIANFIIQENLLQGKDGRIVFQNENIDTLSELLSPKAGQTINVSASASASDTFTNSTVTDIVRSSVNAVQDFTVQYPGVVKFSIAAGRDDSFSYVEGGTPAFVPAEGEPHEYKCEVLRKTGSDTYETIDSFRPSSNGTIAAPLYFDRNIYLPSTGEYRIRFVWESTDKIYWIKKPQDWPDDRFPILTTKLSAAITGQSPVDRTHIYYSGSDALTKIGTDGLYSFWSLYNYLYFSQSEGLKIKAGTTISSPNGEYSLTVNDSGISISGQAGTNASNNVVDFTVSGTRVNIQTGEKLSVAFGKIAKWFTDLKTVAFTGSYNDLSNTPKSLPANGGNADTVDGLHAAAAGSVENGKLASYDPAGRLRATVLETTSFLRTGSGPDTGLSFGTDSIPGTHTPYYGIFVANPSEIGLSGYGDVTSDYAILSPVAGYNTATNNNRGWMFYNPVTKAIAASLSQRGYAKFAGEVTASAFHGKADSAATADKATADGSGNNIAQTYLPKELVNTNGLYKIMRGADHMGSWLNLVRMSGNATVAQLRINVDGTMSFYNGIAGGESNIVWHAGNFNPDTKADKTQLPTITYSVSEPSNPKNGDIWIVPTD